MRSDCWELLQSHALCEISTIAPISIERLKEDTDGGHIPLQHRLRAPTMQNCKRSLTPKHEGANSVFGNGITVRARKPTV